MARTKGSKHGSYESRRSAIIGSARKRLAQAGYSHASLRDIASACGISLPTLRHYFPRREDLITAILAQNLADGEVHLAHIATAGGDFASSVREAMTYTAYGFSQGLGEVHTLGLTEGLRNEALGPAFVEMVLEPSIGAVRQRFDAHVASGQMRPANTTHAALALLAPIILAFLHQDELGGRRDHALDIEAFIADHADAFIRGYATPQG